MAEELIALASQFSQRMGGGVPVAVCAEPMGAPGRRAFPGQSCCACAVRMQMGERPPASPSTPPGRSGR